MSTAPDVIEQVARYLQARTPAVGDRGWDAISERGRELYRQRAREIAAILARPAPTLNGDPPMSDPTAAQLRAEARDLYRRAARETCSGCASQMRRYAGESMRRAHEMDGDPR